MGGIPLIICEVASVPKDIGGWEKIYIFNSPKPYLVKGVGILKLLTKKGIWKNILFHKYVSPKSIEEWVKVTQ